MSNCSCIYIDTDWDENDDEKYDPEDVIYKTDQKCDECKRVIKAGEKFEKFVGKNHDGVYHQKTCVDCESIRTEFFCQGWYWGMVIEDLQNHIDEVGGEISEDCLADLTPGARNKVCELIEELWEGS